ncbi:hypothetical protein BKA80DRAFT_262623 [Phyllosticta citrichinensis]
MTSPSKPPAMRRLAQKSVQSRETCLFIACPLLCVGHATTKAGSRVVREGARERGHAVGASGWMDKLEWRDYA